MYKENAKEIIKKVRGVKFGRNVIASQLGEVLKRRLPANQVLCKYFAPMLPDEPQDLYFFLCITKPTTDEKEVKKVCEEEIEKLKEYYPEIEVELAFIKE